MFDFPMKETSIWTSLYCLIGYSCILGSNFKNGLEKPFSKKICIAKHNWTFVLICFFFITHCLKGDFFHFMETVHNYIFVPGYYNYGEEIYITIGKLVNRNYLLVRAIVWGGAFTLFCITAKRLEIPLYYAAVYLFATHSVTFAYARVTLAMAVYFFGLSFLIYPNKKSKMLSYVIGVLIICSTWAFHNSGPIMMVMTCMILVPLRKWNIVVAVFAIPLLASLFKDYLLLFSIKTSNVTLADKIMTYSERELNQGVFAMINSCIEYLSFYIPFVIICLCIFRKKNKRNVPEFLNNLFKVTFGLILVSTTFFCLGKSFVTFFYRILFMTMIPLSLIVVKLREIGLLSNKYFQMCYIPGIIFLFLKYLYNVYLSSFA